MKHLFILLVILVLVLTGCGCDCPEPSPWSICDKHNMRHRTVYECDDCEPRVEQETCPPYIVIQGSDDMQVIVSPSRGNEVKGVINISVLDAPDDTEDVEVYIFDSDMPYTEEITQEIMERTIVLRDSEPEWDVLFDTNRVVNGYYVIFIGAKDSDEDWIATASTRMDIRN